MDGLALLTFIHTYCIPVPLLAFCLSATPALCYFPLIKQKVKVEKKLIFSCFSDFCAILKLSWLHVFY